MLRVNYVCIISSGLPGVPGDLEVIGQRSDLNESTIVDLRWSPPEDTGGVTLDHYTLTITSSSPPPFLPLTILTNDTTYTVTLPSNMTYNMTVTASNCAETSLGRYELFNLSFSKYEEYSITGSYFTSYKLRITVCAVARGCVCRGRDKKHASIWPFI